MSFFSEIYPFSNIYKSLHPLSAHNAVQTQLLVPHLAREEVFANMSTLQPLYISPHPQALQHASPNSGGYVKFTPKYIMGDGGYGGG